MPFKDPEESRIWHRLYKKANADCYAEYAAKYRENHREQLAAKQKERNRRRKEGK